MKRRFSLALLLVLIASLAILGSALAEDTDLAVIPLAEGVTGTANVPTDGEKWVYFSFTPDEATRYLITMELDCEQAEDTNYGIEYKVFEGFGNIAGDWYYEWNNVGTTYSLMMYLNPGTTYYLRLSRWDEERSGSLSVTVEKYPGITEVTSDGSNKWVEPGTCATFNLNVVTRDPSVEVTYQWYYLGEVEDEYLGVHSEWFPIQGATGPSYTTDPITRHIEYQCDVSDGLQYSTSYGFDAYVDNHLTAYAFDSQNTYRYINAPINSAQELSVTANCSEGALTYQWYVRHEYYSEGSWTNGGSQLVADADGPTLTTEAINARTYYDCLVTDGYGNEASVTFDIAPDNQLTAYVAGDENQSNTTDVYAAKGDTAILSVAASCLAGEDTLTYRWEVERRDRWNEEGEYWEYTNETIEGADGPQVTTDPINAPATYRCYVYDGFGNDRTVYFYTRVENHFTATHAGDSEYMYVEPYVPVTLEVIADCDEGQEGLSYQWSVMDRISTETGYYEEERKLDGETGSALSIDSVTEERTYYCHVSDNYGDSETLRFHIYVQSDLQVQYAEGQGWSMTVPMGDTVTLQALATSKAGDAALTYQWYTAEYYFDEEYEEWTTRESQAIEGATSAEYTTDEIERGMYYECQVRDGFNSIGISFRLLPDTGFTVYAGGYGGTTYTVPLGDTTTLEVVANSTGPLRYHWYKLVTRTDDDGNQWTEWERIPGETDTSIATEAIRRYTQYRCVVFDEYGNQIDVDFDVYADANFSLTTADGNDYSSSLYVAPGDTPTLSVIASSDAPGEITYQWGRIYYRKNQYGGWDWDRSEEITGVNSDSFTVVEPVQGYCAYYCNARDSLGNQESVYFYLYIQNNLSISRVGEYNHTVDYGDSVTFSVDASSDYGPLYYQWSTLRWYTNEAGSTYGRREPIEGANDTSYTVDPVTSGGEYYCYVSDDYGNGDYVDFRVSVDNHLSISAVGDTNRLVEPGDTPTLSVTATCDVGQDKLTYQWFLQEIHLNETGGYSWYGSTPIANATSPSLVADPVNAYVIYYCRVSDEYGNNSYCYFHLRVQNSLTLERVGDFSVYATPGEAVTLAVTASYDRGPVTYRWFELHEYTNEDGDTYNTWVAVDGANGDSYTTSPVTKHSQYMCVIRDSYENSASCDFQVGIDNKLTLTRVGSYSNPVVPGGSVTLEVNANCLNEPDKITYRWTGPNGTIEDSNANTYTVENVTQPSNYSCYATDTYGTIRSVTFYVYPENQLRVSRVGSRSVTLEPGESMTLAVNATCLYGQDKLQYQWYDDDWFGELEGATASTYTATPTKSGTYRCRVTDVYGNSDEAYFYVTIDNAFSAKRVGGGTVYVDDEGSATLRVAASCKVGKITYEWHTEIDGKDTVLKDATTDTLALTDVEKSAYYDCLVTDEYGGRRWIGFNVTVNGFWARRVGPRVIQPEFGADVTMTVKARCDYGELSYRWYYGWEDKLLEDATRDTLTIADFSREKSGTYTCIVTDERGNETRVSYYLEAEDAFQAYRLSDWTQTAFEDAQVTFSIFAKSEAGGLKLQWYHGDNDPWESAGEAIEGATGDTLTITAGADSSPYYWCRVTDDDKNDEYVDFRLTVLSGARTPTALSVNAETAAMIEAKNTMAYFSFTPAETKTYSFTSATGDDTYGYLFDSSWNMIQSNDDGGEDNNFRITQELESGKTYYYAVRFYDENDTGSFPVKLTEGAPEIVNPAVLKLTADRTSAKIGQDILLQFEHKLIWNLELHEIRDGEDRLLASWNEEDLDSQLEYVLTYDEPQTVSIYAWFETGTGELQTDPIEINVTSSGTLSAPTLGGIVADDEGVKVSYTLPANADHLRVRATVGGVRKEFWTTKSGTWNIANGKLPLGPNDIEIEATAYGEGYYPATSTTSGSIFTHAANLMTLPAALTTIDEEAFADLPVEEVVIGSKCKTIGKLAFSGCASLKLVHMPDSVTSIADDAFEGCGDVTFYCQSNNAAAAYAKAHNIPYVIK